MVAALVEKGYGCSGKRKVPDLPLKCDSFV